MKHSIRLYMITLFFVLRAGGFKSDPIIWNGNSDDGAPLRAGLYIYRIIAAAADGHQQQGVGKLTLTR